MRGSHSALGRALPAPALARHITCKQGARWCLLDALNEMPHSSEIEYNERVALWRAFIPGDRLMQGNRALFFSCRSLDYSEPPSAAKTTCPCPSSRSSRLSQEKVREFIEAYNPAQAEMIWKELNGTPQFDLYLHAAPDLKLLLRPGGTPPARA